MRLFLFLAIILSGVRLYAQTAPVDSCSINPSQVAFFQGFENRSIIKTRELNKIIRLVSDDKDIKIVGFTFSIDPGDDIYVRRVYSDTLSIQEAYPIRKMKKGYLISFGCINGVDRKGDLVCLKPFIFFIK